MGRIVNVFTDSVGHVCTAWLETNDTLLVRPITTLMLLFGQEPQSV